MPVPAAKHLGSDEMREKHPAHSFTCMAAVTRLREVPTVR